MDAWEEKNLENRIKELLSNKNPDYRFAPYDLRCIETKNDDYYKTLKSFKFLYHLCGEAQIYLWNEIVPIEVKRNRGRSKSSNTILVDNEKINFGVKLTNGNIGFENNEFTFPYYLTFL